MNVRFKSLLPDVDKEEEDAQYDEEEDAQDDDEPPLPPQIKPVRVDLRNVRFL
jgi:hypothetical protein